MSEVWKVLLGSTVTVFSGLLALVFGSYVTKFVLEPLQDYKNVVGEIAGSLILYGNVGSGIEDFYLNQLDKAAPIEELDVRGRSQQLKLDRVQAVILGHWERNDAAQVLFRQQGSQLRARANAIPVYGLWVWIHFLPKLDNVLLAAQELVGLSNSTHEVRSSPREESSRVKIARLLRIKTIAG